jgi:DNA-binding helix-hairpin-helix protein with protein kinase domain
MLTMLTQSGSKPAADICGAMPPAAISVICGAMPPAVVVNVHGGWASTKPDERHLLWAPIDVSVSMYHPRVHLRVMHLIVRPVHLTPRVAPKTWIAMLNLDLHYCHGDNVST